MVQQDGSVCSKLRWGSLSNLKTFPNIFQVSYSNRKDSSVQSVMNELLNNWSDLILKLILPSCYLYPKILKVFCDFSNMISQWFTCSGLRFFSSVEVWWQISLQGNNGYLIEDEYKEKFHCLKFYQITLKYLLENLPHDNKIIKYAKHLHPKKRNESFSTRRIPNTALAICFFFFLAISFLISNAVRNAR